MLTHSPAACKDFTVRDDCRGDDLVMAPQSPVSLWDATAAEPDITGDATLAETVDVAIVGGGFTGLSTALHVAEKGLSVQVLEAEKIGFGGSGRNVGLVNAGVWLPPARVSESLAEPYGSRFLEFMGRAPETVFALIDKHAIACEATRTGTMHAAHDATGLADLKHRHAEWLRLGAPVELLSAEEMAERSGISVYHGALLDRRAGTVNPMGYCRGLGRAARAAGARIATGTRVQAIGRRGDRWRLETPRGQVSARHVVLGTNAYSDALWPGLRQTFTIIRFLQFATRPLGDQGTDILPERQGVWDTAPIMFSCRRDAFGRLIVGSMGRVHGSRGGGLSRRWALRRIRRVFPALDGVEFEQAWDGRIAMTPDHLPRIHQLAQGLWTPVGYNGRGITTGTVFGQVMAEVLTGKDTADLPLPVSDMKTVAGSALKSAAFGLVFSANQAWKSLT